MTGLGSPASATDAGMGPVSALEDVAVLEDPQGRWTLEQVRGAALAGQFKSWPIEQGQINLGFSNSTYWVRIGLQSQQARRWVLELPYFRLNTVDFYAPGQAPVQTGSALPLNSRPYLHRFYAFPIEIGPERQYHYLRVSSKHSLTVPLVIWPERAFLQHAQVTLILQFIYYGALIALGLYNLFLAASLRDLRFLLYALFAGTFGVAMMAGNGLGQMFLWPEQAHFDALAETFFLSLAGALAMLFSNRFLEAASHAPKASLGLKSLALLYLLAAALLLGSLWYEWPVGSVTQAVFAITMVAGVLVPAAGVQVRRRGKQGIRFFLLAWVVLWSGALVATLRAYGWVPTNAYTAYSLQISSALEMLLLALALADVVHLEREDRERAQREALQAKQERLDASRRAEEQLEQAVQDRTLQLEAALDEQHQLLGRYVRFGALISHEFRNPLAIVDSQISLLRKQASGLPQIEKRLDVMSGATARLLSLFETWVSGDRLQQAMDAFEPQYIPLAAWLRELIDARSLMEDSHPIELSIDAALGDVWADEGLLEVALLNLLDNACKYSAAGQPVGIEVQHRPGWVGITVLDTGRGIDPKDHEAIFKEYFRVQPEGGVAGIGLGLAFVRRIAQLHDGHVELSSAIGQGSRFSIWLPDAQGGQSA